MARMPISTNGEGYAGAEYRPFTNDSDGLFGRLRIAIEAFDSGGRRCLRRLGFRNRFSLDQKALQHYLRTDVNDDYDNNPSDAVISSDAGFFGDFAYTNAMKNQAPTKATTWGEDDREWLQDEIAAVNPMSS